MSKMTTTKDIKVSLISYTKDPEFTAFKVWLHSRPFIWKDLKEIGISSMDELEKAYSSSESSFMEYLDNTVESLMNTDLPMMECVSFTFSFDNLPVYIRDQLVRHRDTSVWAQTSRNNNDSAVFDGYTPDEISSNKEAQEILEEFYKESRDTFSKLLDLGIPAEDARAVIPSGKLTALCWTMNFRVLRKVLRERSCFIAQGPWKEIICQIKEELEKNGMKKFAEAIGQPPCKYKSCIYSGENEQRRSGHDILPICPLYCKQRGEQHYPDNQNFEYLYKNLEVVKRVWNPKVVESLEKFCDRMD